MELRRLRERRPIFSAGSRTDVAARPWHWRLSRTLLGQDISFACITCSCGRNSTRFASRFRASATPTPSPITLKPNTNSLRSSSPRCAGISNFSTVSGDGDSARWGRDIWRIDSAVAYRFTPHTQLKLQYSLQDETSSGDLSHLGRAIHGAVLEAERNRVVTETSLREWRAGQGFFITNKSYANEN